MALARGLREAQSRLTSALTAAKPDALGKGTSPALLRMAAQERALRRGALQIFAQTDEEALLRVALDVVCSLLQVDVVALFLTSDGPSAPRCRAIRRQDTVQLLPPDEAPMDALASDVLRRQAPRHRHSWSPPGGAPCRSALAVPLESQGAALGVIVVGRTEADRFRDDHAALLSAAAQQLALALLRLRAQRLRTEFVAMASHEMRTPLSALQGFTELMLSREVPPQAQRDWLCLMNHEAERLAALIEEMLDMTRMESGAMKLKLALVQVSDVLSRVVRLLDGDGRRIHVVLERTPTVLADCDKLAQVITNLLRNALDYSPPERPVEVQVAPRCLAQHRCSLALVDGESRTGDGHDCHPTVSVAVRDQGIGMTPEQLSRAFRPFFRTDASRELLPEGTGLGLAITKAIIERHQGCLWARSRPGRGSIFGFCLPAQEPPPDGAS